MPESLPFTQKVDGPVLVTGASGLVGRWLVLELAERGLDVVAFSRKAFVSRANRGITGRIIPVAGDVTDTDLMRSVFECHSISVAFHLAAQSITGDALQEPARTLDCNVRGTWNVLEASRSTNHCPVLLASSARIYGSAPDAQTEESDVRGNSPYEISKACAESITRLYANSFGVPTAILRLGNIYGGGDMNFSRVVPGAIRAGLRGDCFQMRGDGSSKFDFFYVEDAVSACIATWKKLASGGGSGDTYNFGTGSSRSVAEIVEIAFRAMGRADLPPVYSGVSDRFEQHLDIQKARRELAWVPAFGLEEGLRHTINWYRQYFSGEQQGPGAHIGRREAAA